MKQHNSSSSDPKTPRRQLTLAEIVNWLAKLLAQQIVEQKISAPQKGQDSPQKPANP